MKDLVYGFKNRVDVKDLIDEMRKEFHVDGLDKQLKEISKANDKPKVPKPIKKPKKKNIFAKKVKKKVVKKKK